MSRAFNNYVGAVQPKCPFCRTRISNAEHLLNNFVTSPERRDCSICSELDCEMICLPCDHEVCCQCFIQLMKADAQGDYGVPLLVRPGAGRPRSTPSPLQGAAVHLGRVRPRSARLPHWAERRADARRRQELRRRENGWRV